MQFLTPIENVSDAALTNPAPRAAGLQLASLLMPWVTCCSVRLGFKPETIVTAVDSPPRSWAWRGATGTASKPAGPRANVGARQRTQSTLVVMWELESETSRCSGDGPVQEGRTPVDVPVST